MRAETLTKETQIMQKAHCRACECVSNDAWWGFQNHEGERRRGSTKVSVCKSSYENV